MALVDRRRDRHQLDGRDAEPRQVRERGGVGEARAGAAQGLRHARMRAREAAHVQLVEDRLAPTARADARTVAGSAGGVTMPLGTNGALSVSSRVPRSSPPPAIAGCEGERPIERPRIRIDEQLRGIEAVTRARVVRAVRPQAVAIARRDAADEAVKHVAGAFRQRDPLDLALAARVEQAELDRGRVRGDRRRRSRRPAPA